MGGVSSELAGGDFGEGAMWGALYAGVGFVASTLAHGAYNNAQAKAKIQETLTTGNVTELADIQRGLAYAERVAEGMPDALANTANTKNSLSVGSKVFKALNVAAYKAELAVLKITHAPIHVANSISEAYGPMESPVSRGLEYATKNPQAAAAIEQLLPIMDNFLEERISTSEQQLELWRNYGN